jgi:hypothetical protein
MGVQLALLEQCIAVCHVQDSVGQRVCRASAQVQNSGHLLALSLLDREIIGLRRV